MKVTLAGATVDRRFWVKDPAATPETISAAYARISHSPKRLSALRDEAVSQVEKARRSNENIVYKMGHSSVAEHAVFNIDVEDASRLLVEFIEHHRLASFTERSQRYVFFGGKEMVIPQELQGTDLEDEARRLESEKYELYKRTSNDPDLKEKYGESLLEQARYVLGLTCPTDLGLTINAREAELIISRGASHPLAEVREFSRQLLEQTGSLAPSLIKYTRGCDFMRSAMGEISSLVGSMDRSVRGTDEVLPSMLPIDGRTLEREIAAAMMFESSGMPMQECRDVAGRMGDEELRKLFLPVFRDYPVHASMPRAFEMADLTFVVELSASAFAQLKRHRMATLIPQRYDPRKWVTPPVFEEPAFKGEYYRLMERSRELQSTISRRLGPEVAQYVLANGHVRRVILKLNLRELHHFARLRSDVHAQEEIRELSNSIVAMARKLMPVAGAMLCGKDGFENSLRRALEPSCRKGGAEDETG